MHRMSPANDLAHWHRAHARAGRLFPILLAAVLLACAFTR